jgi:DamX protein
MIPSHSTQPTSFGSVHLETLFTHTQGDYFLTQELAQRLNLMRHLIQYSDQLLLILAEKGAGKTSVRQEILAQPEEHWQLLAVDSHPDLGEHALLKILLDKFNVKTQEQNLHSLQNTLRTHIAATRYNNQIPILLVDDAHMLPLESLSLLVQLAMAGEAQDRMRVLLFCEPQITSIFAAPEFEIIRHNLIHTLDIPPLNEQQVREYLRFYLHSVEYDSNPFSGMSIQNIYLQSEGIPGTVNQLADTIWQQHLLRDDASHTTSSTEQQHSLQRPIWWLSIALIFGILTLGAYWLKNAFNDLDNTSTIELPALNNHNETEIPLPIAPQNLQPDMPIDSVIDVSTEPAFNPVEITPYENINNTNLDLSQLPDVPGLPNFSNTLSHDELEDITPADLKPEIINDVTQKLLPNTHSASWLQAQPPEYFTLQIMGSYALERVAQFINKHHLKGDLSLYKTQHNGRDWYVLTYGVYQTKMSAHVARSALPKALQKTTKPWLRPLSIVQSQINKSQ